MVGAGAESLDNRQESALQTVEGGANLKNPSEQSEKAQGCPRCPRLERQALLASVLRMVSEPFCSWCRSRLPRSGRPSLIQWMSGAGSPWTTQSRRRLPPTGSTR